MVVDEEYAEEVEEGEGEVVEEEDKQDEEEEEEEDKQEDEEEEVVEEKEALPPSFVETEQKDLFIQLRVIFFCLLFSSLLIRLR